MQFLSLLQKRASRASNTWLVAGLVILFTLATAFTVAIVQVQAGVAAYLAAESAWSRSQTESVRHLDRYAETGDARHLIAARRWLNIPLGDLAARRAMEANPPDYDAARFGFLQGEVHPNDVPRLIWLFRHLVDAPYFRAAVEAWRNSDRHIEHLTAIADQLEGEWRSANPSGQKLALLRNELADSAEVLEQLATDFRAVMVAVSHLITNTLSIGSVLFFAICGAVATTLAFRLTRVIRHSEHKFRATFEQAAMGIAQIDEHGQLLEVNEALCKILRYPRDALVNRSFPELVHHEDRHANQEQRQAMAKGEQDSNTSEVRLLRGDGSTVWGRMTISRFDAPVNLPARYIAIVEDVSEHRRLTEELSHQASHDELTGLLNRRAFEQCLDEALRGSRSRGAVHVLCFLDLDQFKIVNDTSGHYVGDALLRQVADVLAAHLRESDILARIGGDEFALILTDCDAETGIQVAEKLRHALVDSRFAWEDRSFDVGCSIGVVKITATSTDTVSLLRAADAACHVAKERGRNRIYLAEEDDLELTERRQQMEWVGRIRRALEQDRMFVDAQRIVSLSDSRRLRYEVLVRMTDEQGAVLPPSAFLPAAERFGISHLIDRWVLQHVCEQLAAHPEHIDRMEACHINLSARSFDHEDFFDFIVSLLQRYRLAPEKICFEITETAAMRKLDDVRAFMERLRQHGCDFALDDFGAGLSSFGYLRELPVNFLKIDGSFVRNLAINEADRAVVRAINDMGQALGKSIVAEFVEDSATAELLRGMGVHFAQGFGVHSPSNFLEFINTQR